MGFTLTFGSVTLSGASVSQVASQRKGKFLIKTVDTLLLSGLHSVQPAHNTGFNETYVCTGPWSTITSLVALVGTLQTLTITGTPSGTLTYTNCAIAGDLEYTEISPAVYHFTVTFCQQNV